MWWRRKSEISADFGLADCSRLAGCLVLILFAGLAVLGLIRTGVQEALYGVPGALAVASSRGLTVARGQMATDRRGSATIL